MLTIRITSSDNSLLTPHELLEDFADSSPGWQYLNEVSSHFSAARGKESCILRSWKTEVPGSVDVVFSGVDDETLELTIVAQDDLLTSDSRSNIVQDFADEFDRYLESCPTDISAEQLEPVAA